MDHSMPDWNSIVRAWLDIPDRDRSPHGRDHSRSGSLGESSGSIGALDTKHHHEQHNPPNHFGTPSHNHHSVLPNLIHSPPPVSPLGCTFRDVNRHPLSSRLRWNQVRLSRNRNYDINPVSDVYRHPHLQHPSGLLFPGPSARLLVDGYIAYPCDGWSAPRLPQATPQTTPESTARPSILQCPPSSALPTIAADSHTFVSNLSSAITSSSKRKHSYASQSHTSGNSDIRVKRRAMQRLSPPLSYVFGPLRSPPLSVAAFIARFDMAHLEYGCIPWTTEVEALLHTHNPPSYYPPHARNRDIPADDEPRALALATWAISVYGLIINCTERAQDEATWSAPVRQLLSIIPPSASSIIPSPPTVAVSDQMLFTIDATTKLTRKTILPEYPTVKVDALLSFNPQHPALRNITRLVIRHDFTVNALSDAAIDDCIVLLGVEIKGPTGDAGPATAEYQLGVWGAKTLEVARQLAGAVQPSPSSWCDLVVGLTVCGHSWSAYVVFWDNVVPEDEDGERGVVVYGPIEVASSANLYGVFKLIAFMTEINRWALEVLEDWKERVTGASERIAKTKRETESL